MVDIIPNQQLNPKCQIHTKHLVMLCETCAEVICSSCQRLMHNAHQTSQTVDFEDELIQAVVNFQSETSVKLENSQPEYLLEEQKEIEV